LRAVTFDAVEKALQMKRIYFVRHGVTSFTEEPERFCGVSDPPLSNHGHAQISSLADALEGIVNPSLVLHSPLRRAVQTASILAEQLDCSHLGCDDLREVAFGAQSARCADICL